MSNYLAASIIIFVLGIAIIYLEASRDKFFFTPFGLIMVVLSILIGFLSCCSFITIGTPRTEIVKTYEIVKGENTIFVKFSKNYPYTRELSDHCWFNVKLEDIKVLETYGTNSYGVEMNPERTIIVTNIP